MGKQMWSKSYLCTMCAVNLEMLSIENKVTFVVQGLRWRVLDKSPIMECLDVIQFDRMFCALLFSHKVIVVINKEGYLGVST